MSSTAPNTTAAAASTTAATSTTPAAPASTATTAPAATTTKKPASLKAVTGFGKLDPNALANTAHLVATGRVTVPQPLAGHGLAFVLLVVFLVFQPRAALGMKFLVRPAANHAIEFDVRRVKLWFAWFQHTVKAFDQSGHLVAI